LLRTKYVERLQRELESYPQAGYAHAAVQEIGANGLERRVRVLSRPVGYQSGDESLKASVSGYRVAANICMFRAEALKRLTYYRALNFAEDWDLSVRLADAGWGNVYVNEVLSDYRVWDTPTKVRSHRKLAEVDGCRRVIEDSLIPAFERRDWSLAPINSSRRRMALRHAECLRLAQFDETEQNDLKQALCLLGDSLTLQWKFRWIRTPLAPLFELPTVIAAYAKERCKLALFQTQR
jgi:hypothetical protein